MEHVYTTPGFEDGWDGYEEGFMQVSLSFSDEVSPWLVAICDKFYLCQDTGTITLWKKVGSGYIVLLKTDTYDTYSIDFLYEEMKVVN